MKDLCLVSLLFASIGLMGCQQSTSTQQAAPPTASGRSESDEVQDHSVEGHAHALGPHDGTIADWGGGTYHVEFTVNHEKRQATAYVLGSDEKTAMPIDAESIELSIVDPAIQVTLNAAPQEGDPEGKSSRFVGEHEKLGVVQEYVGTMTGVVEGTPYSGNFKEAAHGDHEH